MHLVLGCLSTVLIWFVFWIHFRVQRHPEQSYEHRDRFNCGFDGTSRRVSQWRKRAELDAWSGAQNGR